VPPIRIGAIFCLTGEIASGCNAINEGAQIGVDVLNRSGGINGRTLELEVQDSHYIPKESHTIATKFAANSDILGVLVTGIVETKAAASILEGAKMSYLTLWDSAPAIEALGDYSFGIGPWLPGTYELSADFARRSLKVTKAAIVATQAEWSLSVAEGFANHFAKLGGTVVSSVSTLPQESDFRAVLTKVLSTKPEVIYAPVTAHLIPFFRQLRQLGFKGPVITSDNLTEELLQQGNGVFDGVYQTMVADPENPEAETLKALYRAKFSKEPTMLAFYGWGYDGVRLMAEALRRSDGRRESLRQALISTKKFQGASGVISFTEEGSWPMPLNVFQVVGSHFVRVS
jgi:branched-chain amino acid transport system substrate-binding protein